MKVEYYLYDSKLQKDKKITKRFYEWLRPGLYIRYHHVNKDGSIITNSYKNWSEEYALIERIIIRGE